jgi:hypothetical protein
MKLQMKREALVKLNRMANEQNSVEKIRVMTTANSAFKWVLTQLLAQFATKTQQDKTLR